jgi:hypothetical protein
VGQESVPRTVSTASVRSAGAFLGQRSWFSIAMPCQPGRGLSWVLGLSHILLFLAGFGKKMI